MLMTSPLFTSPIRDDCQFVASLQEVQRCVERLQSLAAFVCSLQLAQGIACADSSAIDTEIERAVHMAAHEHLMQQLRIRHARDDALIAEAASFFLSMDPEDMGVATQHAAAVRDAVAFSMHRKHRSLNRRRSSIDALSMLSRGDNVSPTPVHIDQESSAPADADQNCPHNDHGSPQFADGEVEVNVSSENGDATTVKPSVRVEFHEDYCLQQGSLIENFHQQSDEFQQQQQEQHVDPQFSSIDQVTPQIERLPSDPSPSIFLPIDVLSISSSGSVAAGSLRSSPHEEGATSGDVVSSEATSVLVSDQAFKIKRRGSTGTLAGVEGRRGSVDFDSESFLSLGGGGRFSFIDLSEPAQVQTLDPIEMCLFRFFCRE